ncbi:phosphate ABC transporter substrate-binding protein [Leuconostoc mesenteroides subsp. mesenteroides]|uniref:phosphate ABC transporter substrate-binding protein n=1 Tax=Leuconostoc mesenteroides TaxID=1245 RepID=UPI0009FBEAA3|nr:phosphate ABC transporter substrate-binding protein [Leuconostoc mesenteroides]ORI81660.1 phosphate ABC transporter substrate-binding protein [Leuconostoc mesenteroides subsp. mesenteroides]
MNKKIVGIIGGIVVIAAGLALYTSANDKSSDNKTSTTSSSKVSGKVLSLGSTALQPLAEQVAKSFQEKNPNVTITVQGGGSGAGLSQVSDGSAQIGNSDVFAEEKDGIDATKLVDHKVAVVGNDEKIVVINRATGSGTRAVFEKNILDGQDAVQATEQDSNGTVQKIVKTTPGSISYLAFAYLDSDGIKALDLNEVHPNKQNVEDNSWPIWAYEHMYTKGKPTGATKSFLEYFTTKEVQKNIVPKLGYIGLTDMKVTRDASGKVTDK